MIFTLANEIEIQQFLHIETHCGFNRTLRTSGKDLDKMFWKCWYSNQNRSRVNHVHWQLIPSIWKISSLQSYAHFKCSKFTTNNTVKRQQRSMPIVKLNCIYGMCNCASVKCPQRPIKLIAFHLQCI